MGHNCVGHNNPSHNKPGGASPWAAELDDDGSSVFWQPDVTDENGCSLDLMDPAVWERHKLGKLWQSATTEAACEAVREHYANMCSQVGKLCLCMSAIAVVTQVTQMCLQTEKLRLPHRTFILAEKLCLPVYMSYYLVMMGGETLLAYS